MRRVHENDPLAGHLRTLIVALAAAGAAVAPQARSADVPYTKDGRAPATYRVVNLGAGLLASIPDINARGQVSFSLQAGTGASGYFYNGKVVQDIGNLGGSEVLAVDLNDVGQVTGSATTGSGAERAYVWSAGSGMLDIGAPPGANEAEGAAINNAGVVTGTAYAPFSVLAFRWSATSGAESLGAFLPGLDGVSFGDAINDAGLIAGSSAAAGNDRHAFIWTRTGGLVDIDTLDSADALPIDVGARGEVAGNRLPTLGSPGYRPFLWTRATGMVDLGTAGGNAAFVLSMTPHLQMAGLINFADDTQRAMTWSPATGMRNLGTLGGMFSRAYDINARGQAVGYAENRAGGDRAFVWTAKTGLQNLNNYLRNAPPGLVLEDALAINDSGAIVATSNAGLVLLKPDGGGVPGLTLGPVVTPAVVKAGVPLQASVAFVDEGRAGTRSVSWSWGDGSAVEAGRVSERGSAGRLSASHSFAAPGIYTVTVTVVDRNGRSVAVSRDVVVAGTAGGTVAGAGTVLSPAGAYTKMPSYAGKARFSLIASTAAGTQAATAGLHFDLPGLNFRSQDMRLLSRQGAHRVFEGSGTVRGKGGYRFTLSTSAAMPGTGPNRFALRIWHADPASGASVVDYDNGRAAGGRVTQGGIVLE